MMQYRMHNILKIYRELMIIYMCGSQTELIETWILHAIGKCLSIYLSIYVYHCKN